MKKTQAERKETGRTKKSRTLERTKKKRLRRPIDPSGKRP